MARKLAIVFAALMQVCAGAAAQDSSGQYPGVYVLEGSFMPGSAEEQHRLELKCVLAPGVMRKDGKGAGYFLDRAAFRASGEIRYVKGQDYACRYAAATKLETCESKEWSDGKSLTYYRSNVYQTFTPMLQRGHSLLTPEDVVNWKLKGIVSSAAPFAYHRCNCLQETDILSRASNEINARTSDETGRLLYWWTDDPTSEDYELAQKVLEQMGACKPDVS
jgi:hypothetical protein